MSSKAQDVLHRIVELVAGRGDDSPETLHAAIDDLTPAPAPEPEPEPAAVAEPEPVVGGTESEPEVLPGG